jgi:hypothetical protein
MLRSLPIRPSWIKVGQAREEDRGYLRVLVGVSDGDRSRREAGRQCRLQGDAHHVEANIVRVREDVRGGAEGICASGLGPTLSA